MRFSTFSGPRKPLARVSAKRLRQDDELAKSREIVRDRASGWCQVAGPDCLRRGSHAHHVLPRSIRVDHTPENLLWVCVICHARIHDNTREAREQGWLAR